MPLVLINGVEWRVSEENAALLAKGVVPKSLGLAGEVAIGFKKGEHFTCAKMPSYMEEVIKVREPSKEVKGYEDLTRILDEALQQATSGKGKERHAGNKPFNKQPIMEIARMTGLAYQTGQAMKKIQESHTLLEIKGKEAAINELRGAIIYLAAAIKTIEEN